MSIFSLHLSDFSLSPNLTAAAAAAKEAAAAAYLKKDAKQQSNLKFELML